MKLLSFLGTGNYASTCYVYGDQVYTSRYSIAASSRFLGADKVILFLTEEAQQQHAAAVEAELPSGVKLIAHPVPHGRNEAELWDVFHQVSASVEQGEEVAFDVTNGLRSFPLVGLLVAAFLRSGLDVRLKGVLYGAFDVRDQSVEPQRTAMFDLSPMLALLEWASAADRFNRSGDARYLASLVGQQKKTLAANGDRSLIEFAGALGSLSTGLIETSQALHLIRPMDTLEITADLPRRISAARPALERAAAAGPFGMILDSVEKSFAPLGLANPLDAENLVPGLEKQRLIIRRYADWELWVQAITVVREWLVNWFMISLTLVDITNSGLRGDVEKRINDETHSQPSGLSRLKGGAEALRLWADMVSTRNDIDHAGMRNDPGEARNLIKNVQRIIERIDQLPLPESPI